MLNTSCRFADPIRGFSLGCSIEMSLGKKEKGQLSQGPIFHVPTSVSIGYKCLLNSGHDNREEDSNTVCYECIYLENYAKFCVFGPLLQTTFHGH